MRPLRTGIWMYLFIAIAMAGQASGDVAEWVTDWIKLLKHKDPEFRAMGATEIARLGPKAAAAIPDLIAALGDTNAGEKRGVPGFGFWAPDRRVREFASGALVSIGAKAIPAVRDAMASPDEQIRVGATMTLIKFYDGYGNRIVVRDALAKAMADSCPEVRRCAVQGLVKIGMRTGPDFSVALDALSKATADPDTETRRLAVQGLGKIGPRAEVAISRMTELLKSDPSEWVRYEAAISLVSLEPNGEKAIPPLTKALRDRSADVSGAAARSLGAFGPKAKSSVPALVTALGDARDRTMSVSNHFFMTLPVRCDAAEALGRIASEAKAAIPVLRKMLVTDRHPEVRDAAALAVLRIDPQDRGALAAVIKEFDREDLVATDLGAVIQTLSELGPRAGSAVPALIRCLKHGNPSIRAGAAEALASIGDRAVIPDLAGISEDDDYLVREAVEKGLEKLRGPQK